MPGTPLLPRELTGAGGVVFFYTEPTKDPDLALWRSNGTEQGSKRLKGMYASELAGFGQLLLFAGYDDVHGEELWKSNGTVAGTQMVEDLWEGGFDGGDPYSSGPREITRVGSRAFLVAHRYGNGQQLWTTNGFPGMTYKLADVCASQLAGVGATLYFAGGIDDGTSSCAGYELWSSDGNAIGTGQLADLNATGYSNPENMTDVGGTLYFTADDGVHGRELWRYVP